MKKFKKGDKVRCLTNYLDQFTKDAIYIVKKDQLEHSSYVDIEEDDKGCIKNAWAQENFKLMDDIFDRVNEHQLNNDPVNQPSHYTQGKYEVIDVLEDWFPNEPLLWQVGKYTARAKHKGNELQDLKKAQFYLNRKIKNLENKNEK